jgi:hypothetical protein
MRRPVWKYIVSNDGNVFSFVTLYRDNPESPFFTHDREDMDGEPCEVLTIGALPIEAMMDFVYRHYGKMVCVLFTDEETMETEQQKHKEFDAAMKAMRDLDVNIPERPKGNPMTRGFAELAAKIQRIEEVIGGDIDSPETSFVCLRLERENPDAATLMVGGKVVGVIKRGTIEGHPDRYDDWMERGLLKFISEHNLVNKIAKSLVTDLDDHPEPTPR